MSHTNVRFKNGITDTLDSTRNRGCCVGAVGPVLATCFFVCFTPKTGQILIVTTPTLYFASASAEAYAGQHMCENNLDPIASALIVGYPSNDLRAFWLLWLGQHKPRRQTHLELPLLPLPLCLCVCGFVCVTLCVSVCLCDNDCVCMSL